MCFVFAHIIGTTDWHASARRSHEHSSRCEMCGVQVDKSSHVASQVMAYPCANGCCGYVTLRTCCRKCNGKFRTNSATRERHWFAKLGWPRTRRLSGCIFHMLCWQPMDYSKRNLHAAGAQEAAVQVVCEP